MRISFAVLVGLLLGYGFAVLTQHEQQTPGPERELAASDVPEEEGDAPA